MNLYEELVGGLTQGDNELINEIVGRVMRKTLLLKTNRAPYVTFAIDHMSDESELVIDITIKNTDAEIFKREMIEGEGGVNFCRFILSTGFIDNNDLYEVFRKGLWSN